MRVAEWFGLRGKKDPLESIVEAYQADTGSGFPRLVHYWEKLETGHSPSILAALVKADLHRRFEAGERPKILDYLEQFPILAEDNDRVVSLVYEEFCLLEEHGERPDSVGFCDLYSRWRDSLRSQLDYHRELSRAVNAEIPAVDFPQPGDRFDKYRLTSLLGIGGVARVYLATEEELGDRQIAIKVSASFGQEPSILAKLDHHNIVPVFTVATAESGLRGMCMPYRPGVTLEELIRRIGRGRPPRIARAISEALRPSTGQSEYPPEQQTEGWKEFPIQRTFPEAVAWVGLALANALSYLHERGVFHRDIKPANILLALREGPQLLDFNLAQVPSNAEGASAAQKGGTLPYMAPEQLKAFLDPAAWDDVGAPADLYSLGLVLRELLTGRPPELPTSQGSLAREIQSLLDRRLAPTASISEINPGVPPALESIVEKCLAVHPEHRYASARDLAADLHRFLDRKPLVVAPNTSRLELGVNWIYRHHKSVAWVTVSAVLVALVITFVGSSELLDWRFRDAERLLDSGTPQDLNVAHEKFEVLKREHPETARSSLGLGLVILNLHPDQAKEAAKVLADAATAGDAEPVILARLKRLPKSPLLHRTLGLAYEKLGQLGKAREAFQRSIELDRSEYQSYIYLARIDQRESRLADATDHLEQSFEVCKSPEIVHKYRESLLEILVELIDKGLEISPGRPSIYGPRFETHFQHFKDEAEILLDRDNPLDDEYALAFYGACRASIQGALNPEPARARELFQEAEGLFARAKELATDQSSNDQLKRVKLQRKKLNRRRSAITLSTLGSAR